MHVQNDIKTIFLSEMKYGYLPWFVQIWNLGLNLCIMLKTIPATVAYLVPKQLFTFLSTKNILSLYIFNG